MAPRKAKVDAPPAWYEPALDTPTVPEKSLTATRLLTAGESIEKGKTKLRAGSAAPEAQGSTFYPFFMNTIVAGQVPPFSNFFYTILRLTGCRPFISIPTSLFSCRFLPTTVRRMSG